MTLPNTRSLVAGALATCALALIFQAAPASNHELLLALFTGLLGWLTPSPPRPPAEPS